MRASPIPPSEIQHEILRVLWRRGEATVVEVHAELKEQRDLAPTTVATTLSRMEKKGLVRHRTEGRQFVYEASVSEQEVRRAMVRTLTERLFEGDVAALVSHLLDGRDVSPGDLERVKAMIRRREQELEANHGD
jgi:BlaI family penicillinase repressor